MTYDADAEIPCERSELCLKPLLRRTYGIFWDHAILLMSANLVILAVLFVGNELLTIGGGHLLLGPFVLGFFKISLRLARNENTEISDLLSGFEFFLPAFVANIVIHILAILGFAILVVPGFLVLFTYATTFIFILERNLGFWDAMEASRTLVWRNFRRWVAVGLAIVLINLLGAALCFVPLLATLPFSMLLITMAYEEEITAANDAEETLEAELPQDGSAGA